MTILMLLLVDLEEQSATLELNCSKQIGHDMVIDLILSDLVCFLQSSRYLLVCTVDLIPTHTRTLVNK